MIFRGISALMTDDTYALHKWADDDAMTFASAVGIVIDVDFVPSFRSTKYTCGLSVRHLG